MVTCFIFCFQDMYARCAVDIVNNRRKVQTSKFTYWYFDYGEPGSSIIHDIRCDNNTGGVQSCFYFRW